MELGQVISALRQERNLTQEQLALEAGTNAGYVSRIEKGKKEPSLEMLRRLASALDTTVAGLFGAAEGPSGSANAPLLLRDTEEADYTTEAVLIRRLFRELSPENRRLAVEFVRLLGRLQKGETVKP